MSSRVVSVAWAVFVLGAVGCEPTVPGEPRELADGDTLEGEFDASDGDVEVPDIEVDMGPEPGELGGLCLDADPRCGRDLRCIEGRCAPLEEGGPDQPCRAGDPACEPGLICLMDVCRDAPECDDPCDFGETVCADGQTEGYRVCGGLLDSVCTAFGGGDPDLVVRCDGTRVCMGGQCVPSMTGRAEPEVILVIDRGGFPGEQWPAWREAMVGWARDVEPAIRIGAQLLPGAEACTLGPGLARETFSAAPLAELLDSPAGDGVSRPLAQGLVEVPSLLGAPSEGQYVVLIVTGGETCDGEALTQVQYMRGLGIRTRVVHVDLGDAALDPELEALGRAGGLDLGPEDASYAEVDSPAALRAALDRVSDFADPACVDPDRDGAGPFCGGVYDCRPADETSYEGAPELCDGISNDCDAAVDEDVVDAPPGQLIDGVCEGAVQICEAGRFVEPNYALVEGYEHRREVSCDTLDNDCDGRADEELGDRSGPCEVGIGACARQGTWVCSPANPGVSVCSAEPGDRVDEICDGEDNDCDGRTDEDAASDDPEACNGVDDDCDDRIDEDVDLGLCPAGAGQQGIACNAGVCTLACADGLRDADGERGCEAPGYGEPALGDGFTCIIDPASRLPECYGRPDAPLVPAGDVQAVAAGGRHACVLFAGDRDGEVACAGPEGAIADGSAARFTALGVGDSLACGLTPAGDVQCWSGDARSEGTFGRNRNATALTVGGQHVCTLDGDGNAACFGACADGCDGQGDVPAGVRFAALSAGRDHTCGIEADTGRVRCWGAGERICEGAFCAEDQEQAIAPPGLGYRAIAAGGLHTCAIEADFGVRCWGLADGGRTNAPGGSFTAIWAGADHTCARRVNGRVQCWGVDVGGETDPLN